MGKARRLFLTSTMALSLLLGSVTAASPAEPGMPEAYWEITGGQCTTGPDGHIEPEYRMWPEWGQISYIYLIISRYGHTPDSYIDETTGEFMYIAPAETGVRVWRHEEWFAHGVDDPPVTLAEGTASTTGSPDGSMNGVTEFEDRWLITGDAEIYLPAANGGTKGKGKPKAPGGTHVLDEPDYAEVWECVGNSMVRIGLEASPTWSWQN